MSFSINTIQDEFAYLDKKYVYLDSAATTQIPTCVIDTMSDFEKSGRANVHRGMYALAENSTVQYENARQSVQKFINAKLSQEVIFTKNCTEALNIAIHSWGKAQLTSDDTVIVSILEHHSSIVPWLQLQEQIGFSIVWLDTDEHGHIDLHIFKNLLIAHMPKALSITGLSNITGYTPLIKEMISIVHESEGVVFIDAAQMAAHIPIDVQNLDCDFLAFSGHKIYGPTGIGVLYGKRKHLENMPPYLGGGMMIHEVTKHGFSETEIPYKFEAGTPPFTQAIGLHAAIEWQNMLNWEDRLKHDQELCVYAYQELSKIDGCTVFGFENSIGCVSFIIEGIHPHDLTHLLGQEHIALRAGHHCCQPWHDQLGIPATTRMSFGLYNTKQDIIDAIAVIKKILLSFKK